MNLRKLLTIIAAGLALNWSILSPALANWTITTGTGITILGVDAANQGTSGCAAASTECPTAILLNAAGSVLIGQQVAAASLPVVLPSAQITALTPPTTVAVTAASGAFASGALASGSGVDGWNVTEGAKADAVCTLPASTTACSVIGLLKAQANALNGAVPAGGNIVGLFQLLGHAGASLDALTSGATAPGSALQIGGLGSTSDPTAVTNGQLAVPEMTPNGKFVVQPWALTPNLVDGGGSATTTGAITVLAASGSASLKEYLVSLQCGRSDAGTTPVTVAVTEGTKTRTFVIPNNGGGGGNNIQLTTPIVFAANTAVTAAFSTGVTTGYCNAEGFYAP